jgi:HpiC1 cyclase/PEP-CTERM motif
MLRVTDRGGSVERFFSRLSLLVLFVALPGAVAGASVTNGSFEMPIVPVGGFTNFNTGSTAIPGWTVVGPQVSIVSGSYTSLGISFPAQVGTQWLDLTGDVANSHADGVTQTVSTTAGTNYTLSYYVGNVVDPSGVFGKTSTVDVYVNGILVQASTNSGGGTTQAWEQFQTSFLATSSSTLIEFLNGDPSSDNSNGLDNVVLTQTGSAVPEPSTFPFLVAIGVGAVGYLRRRKM